MCIVKEPSTDILRLLHLRVFPHIEKRSPSGRILRNGKLIRPGVGYIFFLFGFVFDAGVQKDCGQQVMGVSIATLL
jgi:hypothetical protein